jgi:hypothetical protein
MLAQPEALTDQPAQAIPEHRVTGRFHGHGETHAGMIQAVGHDAQGEKPVVDASAAGVHGVELQLATQPEVRAKVQSL